MKRVIVYLLVLCTLLGALPYAAADEAAPVEDEAAAEAPEAALPEPTLELGDPDEEDLALTEAELALLAELPQPIVITPDEDSCFRIAEQPATRAAAQLHNLAHFTDVPSGRWYYSYVRQAYEQGLMDGMTDSTFVPTGTMTRGMFVTVIGRIAKVSTGEYKSGSVFSDVPANAYYAPYVSWASQTGVVVGMDATHFMPKRNVTREQAAVMLDRYLQQVLPDDEAALLADAAELAADYGDLDKISAWALGAVARMQMIGLMQGDNLGNFNPKKHITRAEAATVFVRLNALVYGKVTNVNNWFDRDLVPTVSNPIVTKANLEQTITSCKFAADAPACQALISINTVYAKKITTAQRKQPLLFLFEGCGASLATNLRFGALAVLVKNGTIVFLDQYCSSIPDYPFDPIMNDDGQPMPTIQGGIYHVTAVNHKGYAAWHVNNCTVVRFRDKASYFESVSYYIRVHRRSKNVLAPYGGNWVNSCGCILIGTAGTDSDDTYAKFIQAIGLVAPGTAGNVPYQYSVSGTFVVDRSFGKSYMQALGYPEGALKLLGCP